jgi:hypothetical protein
MIVLMIVAGSAGAEGETAAGVLEPGGVPADVGVVGVELGGVAGGAVGREVPTVGVVDAATGTFTRGPCALRVETAGGADPGVV